MAALLDHLPMLAQRDFAGLRRVCGVDDEDLAEMIAEIKALNPKPGEAGSEEHTSELQSLMRISYAVFCLKKKKKKQDRTDENKEHKNNPKKKDDNLQYDKPT